MIDLKSAIERISKPVQVKELIDKAGKLTSKSDCDHSNSNGCFNMDELKPIPICDEAFLSLIINLISLKPKLMDESVTESISQYYKDRKAEGLISLKNLETLHDQTHSPTYTWLKYESLLSNLIKKDIYKPKSMANEVLVVVKNELRPDLGSKLASVLESCVKLCREAGKSRARGSMVGELGDEEAEEGEEEEKWCEIIDWMSWFIGSREEGEEDYEE